MEKWRTYANLSLSSARVIGDDPEVPLTKRLSFSLCNRTQVAWLREALWQTQFTPDRLRVSAQRLLNEIPSYKRNGARMASLLLNHLHLDDPNLNASACQVIRQQVYMQRVFF